MSQGAGSSHHPHSQSQPTSPIQNNSPPVSTHSQESSLMEGRMQETVFTVEFLELEGLFTKVLRGEVDIYDSGGFSFTPTTVYRFDSAKYQVLMAQLYFRRGLASEAFRVKGKPLPQFPVIGTVGNIEHWYIPQPQQHILEQAASSQPRDLPPHMLSGIESITGPMGSNQSGTSIQTSRTSQTIQAPNPSALRFNVDIPAFNARERTGGMNDIPGIRRNFASNMYGPDFRRFSYAGNALQTGIVSSNRRMSEVLNSVASQFDQQVPNVSAHLGHANRPTETNQLYRAAGRPVITQASAFYQDHMPSQYGPYEEPAPAYNATVEMGNAGHQPQSPFQPVQTSSNTGQHNNRPGYVPYNAGGYGYQNLNMSSASQNFNRGNQHGPSDPGSSRSSQNSPSTGRNGSGNGGFDPNAFVGGNNPNYQPGGGGYPPYGAGNPDAGGGGGGPGNGGFPGAPGGGGGFPGPGNGGGGFPNPGGPGNGGGGFPGPGGTVWDEEDDIGEGEVEEFNLLNFLGPRQPLKILSISNPL
ncbi:hypothetical protein B0H16DRAFT_1464976 [Mycena metata]|uniref:Uncharacterized protein n=1 Tax=Mycena metata TaxID=1033252 RepID=A0AAD7ICL0_9AGAR|nr:hypothetical protein B0H16DRAFT_1464976 [Mycena metata]